MGERAFFQIAAGLIPLLTFAGVLLGRPSKPDRYWPRPTTTGEQAEAFVLFLFGLLAITAEVAAIDGAVAGHPGLASRYIVIGTIVLGMWAIVLRATVPVGLRFLNHVANSPYANHPKIKRRQLQTYVAVGTLALGTVVIAVASASTLNSAIRLGEGRTNLHRIDRLHTEVEASNRRLEEIGSQKRSTMLKASALARKGADLSRAEAFEQRLLTSEFKAALRRERLETARIARLIKQETRLYEHAVPP